MNLDEALPEFLDDSVVLFALFAMTLSAADISGTWNAVGKDTKQTFKRTFVFKQDGTKLTGTTTSKQWGRSKIENGKIDGDALSFTITLVFDVGDLKASFTGKVDGDVIKMTEANGKTLDFTAQRAP